MLKLTTFLGTVELTTTLFIMVLLLTVMTDVGRTGGVGVTAGGGPAVTAAAAGAMGRPPKMTGTVLWLPAAESVDSPVALVGVTGAAAVVVAAVAAAAVL